MQKPGTEMYDPNRFLTLYISSFFVANHLFLDLGVANT